MELCTKGSLDGRSCEVPAIPLADKEEILLQIARGIAFLHRNHIVHRDLATRNVLMASLNPPVVKLTDFGYARVLQPDDGTNFTVSSVGPIR